MTRTIPELRIQTVGEARYLKAQLSWLAGWRRQPPNFRHSRFTSRGKRRYQYGRITEQRAYEVRMYAKALADAIWSREEGV
jgi:hypothetical protein